jgi:hypothetical protein
MTTFTSSAMGGGSRSPGSRGTRWVIIRSSQRRSACTSASAAASVVPSSSIDGTEYGDVLQDQFLLECVGLHGGTSGHRCAFPRSGATLTAVLPWRAEQHVTSDLQAEPSPTAGHEMGTATTRNHGVAEPKPPRFASRRGLVWARLSSGVDPPPPKKPPPPSVFLAGNGVALQCTCRALAAIPAPSLTRGATLEPPDAA